jgi:type I restriction enzyme M protein
VVRHIDFTRQVGQTRLSDRKLQQLIGHFDRYRLRNEDFEFPDLLGAAYEYLSNRSCSASATMIPSGPRT